MGDLEENHRFRATPYSSDIASIPRARVIDAAILKRAGFSALADKALGPACMETAETMRVAHTLDLCRAALEYEGIDVPADRDGMVAALARSNTSKALDGLDR